MKKLLIASVSALSLLVAGVSYAASHEAPKGDAKPQQEMKKDAAKPKEQPKKAAKKKCPDGQVYSKQDKKCVAKTAGGAGSATATAPTTTK